MCVCVCVCVRTGVFEMAFNKYSERFLGTQTNCFSAKTFCSSECVGDRRRVCSRSLAAC